MNEQQQLLSALNEIPKSIADILQSQVPSQAIHALPANIVENIQKTSGLSREDLGLALLPLASSFSVAPVSNFNVGAVAFDSLGNAYLGANFEFSDAHIGHTIHAEQSAIANAWQHGAQDLSLLAINYPPCGHCRQFINEVALADNFLIQLPDSQPQPLAYYLPDAFGPSDLQMTQRILATPAIAVEAHDDILSMAHKAHKKSHAPYSNSHSGIALQYSDGEIVTGSYAENAAFNPTLPALQVALNTRRLQGKDWRAIECCVMVESASTLQQRDNTATLLQTICDCELEYHSVDIVEPKHQHQ